MCGMTEPQFRSLGATVICSRCRPRCSRSRLARHRPAGSVLSDCDSELVIGTEVRPERLATGARGG
jgi:hypothetical protein